MSNVTENNLQQPAEENGKPGRRHRKKKADAPHLGFRRVCQNNLFILRTIHEVSPGYVTADLLIDLLWTVLEFLSGTYLLKFVVDGLQDKMPTERLCLLVGLLFALHVGLRLLQQWFWECIAERRYIQLELCLRRRMYAKMQAVELSCYEDPAYYEKYLKAMAEVENRTVQVLWNLEKLVSKLFALLANAILLFSIDPWLVLFALIPFAAGFLRAGRNKQAVAESNDMKKIEWHTSYVQRSFFLNDYAKEMRLTDMPAKMLDDYTVTLRDFTRLKRRYGRRLFWYDYALKIAHEVLTVLGAGFYALYATMVRGTMTAGDCLVVINSIGTVSVYLSDFVTNISTFHEHALFIENLRSFLDYKPAVAENPTGLRAGAGVLRAEHIAYRYAGAERDALSDISMTIAPGEKIALVGKNGSGKTTFVKLLLHMYQPSAGRITLDGQDMDAYNLTSWRQDFEPVFQDYRTFAVSVAANVLRRPLSDDPVQREHDRAVVTEALRQSGVLERVEQMPHGMDSVLTREFDDRGVVLSGGESQKIALARVFAGNAPFVVLDEPTSALDPVAEYTLFENMMAACADRAVIFISHRLSSAVLADRVYLFEDGRVTETGTHAELMAAGGHYAQMFRHQAESYVSTTSELTPETGEEVHA